MLSSSISSMNARFGRVCATRSRLPRRIWRRVARLHWAWSIATSLWPPSRKSLTCVSSSGPPEVRSRLGRERRMPTARRRCRRTRLLNVPGMRGPKYASSLRPLRRNWLRNKSRGRFWSSNLLMCARSLHQPCLPLPRQNRNWVTCAGRSASMYRRSTRSAAPSCQKPTVVGLHSNSLMTWERSFGRSSRPWMFRTRTLRQSRTLVQLRGKT
mmetsp:Transcript_57425/g.159840  ORF Transcript_57425/g.159840 Transcript_57425/m.159840 type:complete len:212 (-) Transcript_57425:1444-2079(-)